jgi:hypothetical protein
MEITIGLTELLFVIVAGVILTFFFIAYRKLTAQEQQQIQYAALPEPHQVTNGQAEQLRLAMAKKKDLEQTAQKVARDLTELNAQVTALANGKPLPTPLVPTNTTALAKTQKGLRRDIDFEFNLSHVLFAVHMMLAAWFSSIYLDRLFQNLQTMMIYLTLMTASIGFWMLVIHLPSSYLNKWKPLRKKETGQPQQYPLVSRPSAEEEELELF